MAVFHRRLFIFNTQLLAIAGVASLYLALVVVRIWFVAMIVNLLRVIAEQDAELLAD